MNRRSLLGLLMAGPAFAQAEIKEYLKGLPINDPAKEIADGRAWLAGKETPYGRWEEVPGGPRVRVISGFREVFARPVPSSPVPSSPAQSAPVPAPSAALEENSSSRRGRGRAEGRAGETRGVYLFLHGGGWVMGTALAGEEQLAKLARDLDITVVTVDYRLAPEHPCPAAIDDCIAAADWVATRYAGLPRVLGGASAGAHLAMMTALARPQSFRGVVLWYGVYDLERPYNEPDAQHPDLRPSFLERCRRRFLGKNCNPREVSPVFHDLSGLPPALLLVGDDDILFEDSVRLAQKYPNAELAVYPAGLHGFDGYDVEIARQAKRKAKDFLLRRLN